MARNPLTPFRSGSPMGGADPLLSLHREMNRLFDDVMGAGLPATGGQNQTGLRSIINANMNVSETDKEIRVSAELPGVKEDDIHVSLEDDVLTIRGEKKFERKDEKESFHFVERSYGTFQRALRLPVNVDPEQVQARFENGVLTVTLPKIAPQERSRRIQIQRAGSQGSTGGEQPQSVQVEGTSGQGSDRNTTQEQSGSNSSGQAS